MSRASEGFNSPGAFSDSVASLTGIGSASSSPEKMMSGFKGRTTPNKVVDFIKKKFAGKQMIVRSWGEHGVDGHYCIVIIEGAFCYKIFFENGLMCYRDIETNEEIEFPTVTNFGLIHFESAQKQMVETYAAHKESFVFPDELKQSQDFLNHQYYSYGYTDFESSDYYDKGQKLFNFIQKFW